MIKGSKYFVSVYNTREENQRILERDMKHLERRAKLTLEKRDFYQKLDEEHFNQVKQKYTEQKQQIEKEEKGDFKIQAVFGTRIKSRKQKSFSEPTVEQTIGYTRSVADEIREFKALFDEGIITEEEFKAKKKQLLGL